VSSSPSSLLPVNPSSNHEGNGQDQDHTQVVLVGADGQLGKTLAKLWPGSSLANFSTLICLDRSQLDITDTAQIDEKLKELNPDIIINAAAYTQVDGAETDRAAAFAVNEQGVRNLALWARKSGSWIIHISTDFVFDGAASSPYQERQATAPLGVYGESKLAGERALQEIVPQRSLIIRTSWLYSEYGRNFLKIMLSLMADREELGIVSDQIGSPSSTHSLSNLIFAIISQQPESGIFHWCDGAAISWFDFAEEIQKQALNVGLLSRQAKLRPIGTEEYPTPATRPAYSVLDRSKALAAFSPATQEWKQELALVLKELKPV
jgi:dTDP-4-dehydrorhamnose reductase